MKIFTWRGYTFTVQAGTAYAVKLRPQLIRIKDAELAARVVEEWKKAGGDKKDD